MKLPQLLSPMVVLLSLTFVAAELCGTVGISTTPPYFTSTHPALYHAVACGERCASDTKCQSYAIGVGMCLHYASPVSSIGQASPSSPWTLYDKDCPPIVAKNAALMRLSQITVPGVPCLIQPNSTKSRFRLTGPDFWPLVPTAEKQLQPLPGALTEEQREINSLQGNVSFDHFHQAPEFFFQQSTSAPAGVYDLVTAGSEPQYVAKTADGGLVLLPASTGSTGQKDNGQTPAAVTSIFTVDCDGRIGVMHDGVSYSWKIDADGKGTSFTAGAHSADWTMTAFDLDTFKNALNLEKSHHELRSLEKRDNPNPGARCPFKQHGVLKSGASASFTNGCGSVKTKNLVPELWFHHCCDDHDTCYDDCSKPSCLYCNLAFLDCMHAECHTHNFFVKKVCNIAAHIYFEAVQGPQGCGLFKEYNQKRCNCVPDP